MRTFVINNLILFLRKYTKERRFFMKKKYNGNGEASDKKLQGPSKPVDLKGKEVEYPVTYNMKAVMDGSRFDDDNKEDIVNVFKNLDIVYSFLDKKLSSNGTYVSFTYKVTITSKDQMYKMYAELRAIKSLKFAL